MWRRIHSSMESSLVQNLRKVQERIHACEIQYSLTKKVQLVAVSKTKSEADILELYQAGHRHFGENYVQELIDKAPNLPNDICWHFIGHLQSQKSKLLLQHVPNLYVLETVDSTKLATKLNNTLHTLSHPPLRIYVQVNTSSEDTKSGVSSSELESLLSHIDANCPLLKFEGLMTIGSPGDMTCFDRLLECQNMASSLLGLEKDSIVLSMGMSDDFEAAIERGSSSVRVGSSIFGNRV